MADFGGGDLNAFRDEVKAWLEANYPPELRDRNAQTDEEAVASCSAFKDRSPMAVRSSYGLLSVCL